MPAVAALYRIEARVADFFDLIRDLQAKHERLRAEVEEWKQAGRKRAEKAEAERDRLREALKEIANAIPQDVRPKFKDIARRALEGSE